MGHQGHNPNALHSGYQSSQISVGLNTKIFSFVIGFDIPGIVEIAYNSKNDKNSLHS